MNRTLELIVDKKLEFVDEAADADDDEELYNKGADADNEGTEAYGAVEASADDRTEQEANPNKAKIQNIK
ncbi:hypothetical protein N0V88_007058 [Collariella sp. IMI 366227]|nr:hypothetical protein N0V88_007058 [Collariella sp. IMI 366227]